MNKSKATILLTIILLASSVAGQQSNESPESQRPFTEVKGDSVYETSNFEFSTSVYKFRISSNGRGIRTGRGIAPRSIDLRLKKNDSLQRVIYHAEYQGRVLLICEVSDGESGEGFITSLDRQTLKMKWRRWIPGFNVGQGLIEGNYAYLTALGFVAKLNLNSGAYVWKHGNLYGSDNASVDFNSFEIPRVEGETVLFKEVEIYNVPAKAIKVQKQSGRILSIG